MLACCYEEALIPVAFGSEGNRDLDLCECNEELGCWICPQMKSIMDTLHLLFLKSCRVGTCGSVSIFFQSHQILTAPFWCAEIWN